VLHALGATKAPKAEQNVFGLLIISRDRCEKSRRWSSKLEVPKMPAPTVLYIEDDFQNRVLVRRVLEASGFSIVEAENGLTGLQLAQNLVPDLILMDINLPEIDGYEVTSRLKQIDALAHVPIIAMTANVMKGDREKTLDAGCDGYIQKPIDVDLLPEQINRYLAAMAQDAS
jgi:two-component system cell cycle response regulator DivK